MGTKKEELESTTSCLAKADMAEPIFVLRAQDEIAPQIVRWWAHEAELAGCSASKVGEARALATRMEQWQKANHKKVPD
jgi:hypothetical protein